MPSTWLEALSAGADLEVPAELYHENSKLERHRRRFTGAAGSSREPATAPAAFVGYPVIPFSDIGDVEMTPATARLMKPNMMPRDALSIILSRVRGRGRGADAVSACDLYLNAATVREVPPGLYHYDRVRNAGVLLAGGDLSDRIAAATPRPAALKDAGVHFFITAAFSRAAAAYGARGYRHALIEAGHIAERLAAAAGSFGLVAVEVADFYDREIDRMLRLDGVTAGVLAIVAIGSSAAKT